MANNSGAGGGGGGAPSSGPSSGPHSGPSSASLATLSLSASSSLSGSSSKTDHQSPIVNARFKHYHKPTVSDSPRLVELCHRYIEEENVEALAQIARVRGLPPSYRQYAWPLLLAHHPYVVNPVVVAEFPTQPMTEDKIPYRRIRGDISRYRKRLKASAKHAASGNFHFSHQHSSASTPMSVSPTNSSSGHSLTEGCSSGASGNSNNSNNENGVDQAFSQFLQDTVDDQRYRTIEDAIVKFLDKWGHMTPYESGMAWVAFALAEWVSPVFELDSGSSSTPPPSQSSTPDLAPMSAPIANFGTVFEQFMLVLFHSPAPNADGPYGPCDSPITDRISQFLSMFRRLLPEISSHFDEEDVLSSIGGDEWLLWWIKWMGAKAWNSHDRARVWDMYLGWRPENLPIDSGYNLVEDENGLGGPGLGPDPFWNLVELESQSIVDPHTQHLFVALAMLKSRRTTLMELDQGEIREFLCRVSRSKDTESLVVEAGELWRSWKWNEEHDNER